MTRARGRRVMSENTTSVNESNDSETRKVDFYNQHEGLRGRDPNVMYLDIAERVHGIKDAEALGQKFDFDTNDLGKLPVTAGTPLVTKANLGDNLVSHPSTALLEANNVIDGTDPVVTASVTVEPGGSASPFSGTTAADLGPKNEAPVESAPESTPEVTTTEPTTSNTTTDPLLP